MQVTVEPGPQVSQTRESFAAQTVARFVLRWLPAVCVLLTVALTPLWALGRDVWTDEAFSASYAQHPTLGLLLNDVLRNEETPPLYFVALWLWAQVFGSGVIALRVFSLLAGLLAVALFARLARKLLPPAEALVAAFVFAVSSLLLPYLVEIRGYTLTLLLAVVCVGAFERLFYEPERRGAIVGYACSAAALFLTSYFGIALLAAQHVAWLWSLRTPERRRERVLAWLAANLLAALPVLAWLPSLLYQAGDTGAVTSSFVSGPSDFYWLALSLLMNAPLRGAWLGLWFLLAVAGWALMLFGLAADRGHAGVITRSFGLPALLLLAMVLVIQAVAPRYLFVLLPGAALGVGAGYGELARRKQAFARVLVAALLVGMALYRAPGVLAMNTLPQQYFPGTITPWTQLGAVLTREADPATDAVLFHPPWDLRVFAFHYRGPALPLLGARDYDEFYGREGHHIRTTWTTDEALAATRGRRRVWVFYDQLFHQVPRLRLPYRELGHWQADGLELYLYEIDASAEGSGR